MTDQHRSEGEDGVGTTGHEWDGIRELNNPLPRWWLWTFYATVVFAVGYMILYPAIPLVNGATKGLLGWSSRADLRANLEGVEKGRGEWLARIGSSDMPAILANPELNRFAVAGGQSAFKVYCVQCHGSDASGSKGYPNLNDDDWIWGGTPDDLLTTITHGIRSPSDGETRFSEMPAFGRDEMLEPAQIEDVAWYVASLSGLEADAAAAARGAQVFADNCAGCHGEKAEGMDENGAPALADAIWLYGSSHERIVAQISGPSHGVMPAWGQRLSENTIKQLAAYVYSLGGGE